MSQRDALAEHWGSMAERLRSIYRLLEILKRDAEDVDNLPKDFADFITVALAGVKTAGRDAVKTQTEYSRPVE